MTEASGDMAKMGRLREETEHSRNYEKAKACVDQTVKEWNRTTLSDLEKWGRETWLIYGEVKAFLMFLSFEEYNDIKEYIWQQYGFNVGGTSGDYEDEEFRE